jgi:glucose-6-phosphate 1-epimerase
LHVTLRETLTVALHITNTGDSPFSFTSALHNYFHVDDVSAAAVEGLAGCAFRDKVIDAPETADTARAVHIEGETDRVYVDGPREVHIANVTGDRSLHINTSGFGDWVIWNPGAELTQQLTDMEPDGYRRMLCVEAALVRAPHLLAPGERWIGTQVIRS